MTTEERQERYFELHGKLDELVADWISHTHSSPSKSTVVDLMRWSLLQTMNPDEGGDSGDTKGIVDGSGR